jgi:hypothetical protein
MASVLPVKLTPDILTGLILLILVVGIGMGWKLKEGFSTKTEGFTTKEGMLGLPMCSQCRRSAPQCKCKAKGMARLVCPPCREPDLSKYVLKSSIPPCPSLPDMSNYMLKTECPPVPDLSKYVLKSSIPKQQPVIIDNSACRKDAGECPPCPRPRCPEVKCPAPTVCPPPAPCPRPICPPQKVTCKADQVAQDTVRPFLAPLNSMPFGRA